MNLCFGCSDHSDMRSRNWPHSLADICQLRTLYMLWMPLRHCIYQGSKSCTAESRRIPYSLHHMAQRISRCPWTLYARYTACLRDMLYMRQGHSHRCMILVHMESICRWQQAKKSLLNMQHTAWPLTSSNICQLHNDSRAVGHQGSNTHLSTVDEMSGLLNYRLPPEPQ